MPRWDPDLNKFVEGDDVAPVASAARTADGDSGWLRAEEIDEVSLTLGVTAAAGTNPRLDVTVETRKNSSDAARTVGTFAQKTAAGSERKTFGPLDQEYRVKWDVTDDNSVAAVLETALVGNDNDLAFAADTAGAGGNAITIAYVDPAGNDAVLGVVVVGNAITVNLATGVAGAITSTAAEVKAAIDAAPAAAALVNVANKAGNDGTGVVTALAATPLAGGTTEASFTFGVSGEAK